MDDSEDFSAMLDVALEGKTIDLDHLRAANGDGDTRSEDKKSSSSRHRSRSRSKERSKRRRSRSSERRRPRSRSRDRKKATSRDKDRSSRHRRSRSPRRRSRTPERRRRSRSPRRGGRRYSRSPARRYSRSPIRRRSPPRGRLPGPERRDVMDFTARKSPPPNAQVDMTPEERDQRTIFILQLARDTRPEDLEDYFSAVGHVRDVRIITDSKTRRSKGIAYVEFWDREAIPLAMGLNGQKLRGAPLVIQQTCAEKNRAASGTVGSAIGFGPATVGGPLKLQVSNLHPSITDDMLDAIFAPFGRIERCYVESTSRASNGYVTFRNAEDGKKAMEQLNNFELVDRNIRITTVDELQGRLDSEDRNLASSSGRLTLMAKLAESNGVSMPRETLQAIANQQQAEAVPEFATQCFMLSNMFDPYAETEPDWDLDVRDDVIEECNANGGAAHVFVDKKSEAGNVYVKCPSILAAHKSVTALHGRIFAGKVITANYVPPNSYHELFPESKYSTKPLMPRVR